jgi:ribosomal protein S18 acetylase RimI-like enzyme
MTRDREDVRLRRGRIDDLDQAFELITELRRASNDAEGIDRKSFTAIFDRCLNAPTKRLLVAEHQGSLVGLISMHTGESLYDDKPWAEVDELVIREGCRSRGIGTRLMDEAVTFARENGCGRLTLTTDKDNADAARFYNRYGLESSEEIILEKQLDREEADDGLE